MSRNPRLTKLEKGSQAPTFILPASWRCSVSLCLRFPLPCLSLHDRDQTVLCLESQGLVFNLSPSQGWHVISALDVSLSSVLIRPPKRHHTHFFSGGRLVTSSQ